MTNNLHQIVDVAPQGKNWILLLLVSYLASVWEMIMRPSAFGAAPQGKNYLGGDTLGVAYLFASASMK
jgi:hypothetical protein